MSEQVSGKPGIGTHRSSTVYVAGENWKKGSLERGHGCGGFRGLV